MYSEVVYMKREREFEIVIESLEQRIEQKLVDNVIRIISESKVDSTGLDSLDVYSLKPVLDDIMEMYEVLWKYKEKTIGDFVELDARTDTQKSDGSDVEDETEEPEVHRKYDIDNFTVIARRNHNLIYEEMLKALLTMADREDEFTRKEFIKKTNREVDHDYTERSFGSVVSNHVGYCLDRGWLYKETRGSPIEQGKNYREGTKELGIDWNISLDATDGDMDWMLQQRRQNQGTSI